MSSRGTVRLATRGSALALRQAALVQDALEDRRYTVELLEIETKGDQIPDELIHRLGTTGAFARAVDEAVLDGRADAAVHSMKDLPTESPEALIVAGIPGRSHAEDVLVTPDGSPLDALPAGATVGTASLRRTAQLLAARPELNVTPLRGNVDTRLEKLLAPTLQAEHQTRLEAEETEPPDQEDKRSFERPVDEWFDDLTEIERRALSRKVDTDYHAIVLAAAGLARAGLLEQVKTQALPVREFVPAPGQGAIAVTALEGSDIAETIHDAIDDPRTRVETTVERIVLAELGGGCIAPIGVHAVIQGEQVHVEAQIYAQDGTDSVKGVRDLPVREYGQGAETFAAELRDEGAADLIESARDDTASPAVREE